MSAAPQAFRAEWRGIGLTINWKPDYFAMATRDHAYAVAHLEITADGEAMLPVTETGYRSHFIQPDLVEAEGGPVAYALAWLEHEASRPAWKRREAAARQLTLF